MATDKNSTQQAHELTIGMFGTLEEVREMAKIEHEVQSYDEARNMLIKLIKKPLINRTGLEVTLSKKSIDKILSGKALGKSFDMRAHFFAAANLKKLFFNAIEPFKFPLIPGKHNENYLEVKRLYSPMSYDIRIIPIKFTVIEMLNPKEGKRLYSVEAIDVDLGKNRGYLEGIPKMKVQVSWPRVCPAALR